MAFFPKPPYTTKFPHTTVQPQVNTGYAVTVRAGNFDKGVGTGHSSVVLQSPAGINEYNVSVHNYEQIKNRPLRSLASGTLGQVERQPVPMAMSHATQVTIPVSPAQFMQAKLHAERGINQGAYLWHAGNNCTHFTHNTLKAAGISGFNHSPFGSPSDTRQQINRFKMQQRLV